MQPRYLLADTVVRGSAEAEGALLGTMDEKSHQQSQAGLSLVRAIYNQSQLEDVLILVTNKCVRPRADA